MDTIVESEMQPALHARYTVEVHGGLLSIFLYATLLHICEAIFVKSLLSRDAMPKHEKTDLCRIPGIGKKMEGHLVRLGYTSVASLRGQDPEAMYEEDCRQSGGHVDRCVLYVYRCAVYYAENERHEPDKLKWWNWKD